MSKSSLYILFFIIAIWDFFSIKSVSLFHLYGSAGREDFYSVVFLLLLECIAVYYSLKYVGKLMTSVLAKKILLWLFYAFLITIITSDSLLISLREMMLWPLIFLLFYVLTITCDTKTFLSALKKFFIPVIFFINVYVFLSMRSVSMENVAIGIQGFDASNEVFYVSMMLPFCFLYKNRWIRYLLFLIVSATILISFKRSAFIYMALALCVLVYFDFLKSKKNNILLRCFYLIILGLGIYFLVDYIVSLTDAFLLTRLESIQDDGGSGRTVIYERMLNFYNDNSLIEQIFGIGFDEAKNLYAHKYGSLFSAHNDFIEMLLDFGIVGLSLYLGIIINIYFLTKRSIILGENYYQANIVAFLCFLVMSMISHLFLYPTYFAFLMILWAVTEGLLYKNRVSFRS